MQHRLARQARRLRRARHRDGRRGGERGGPQVVGRLDTGHAGVHTVGIDESRRGDIWIVWGDPKGDWVQRLKSPREVPHPGSAFVRVLVVEDDEPLRALIARGLAEDGHVIDTLADGRECDEYLAATPYDALVLDLNFPHEDGLSILRRLRARGEATPVLLLTARDAADDVVAGLNAGADDYLRKPFAFIELEARLRRSRAGRPHGRERACSSRTSRSIADASGAPRRARSRS